MTPATFRDFGLSQPLLAAIEAVGYEVPTAIQARTIPALLAGRDVVGQAQTGTGKTAAFAIPILERLDLARAEVQALVLTPTRELSIQVAEAIHTYGRQLAGLRVVPIYGGQPMSPQLRRLRPGVHVVVGTPGRLMDHLRRGSLALGGLRTIVLDEGDEMLRMGFIDDVEWILSQAPTPRQTALFSATMPREIRRIAERHLTDPETVEIEPRRIAVPTIEQRYVNVAERQKLDALTRVLEAEAPRGVLVFVRTKTGAAELAERLQARGYAAEALHGDMAQAQRESVVRRARQGQAEIVVATDVAARGLDIERLSHVVNYDIPWDPESYVHRIGRTGRAGRAGTSILFVTPRETRMLRTIEGFTGQRVAPMRTPSPADIAARRTALFKDRLKATVQEGDLDLYLGLVGEVAEEGGFEMAEVAAAAARLARGAKPLDVVLQPEAAPPTPADGDMVRLFIDAGRQAGVRPADIVGAVAGEADIPGEAIGAIDIYDRFTVLEVPAAYRDRVIERMRGVTIRNRPVSVKPATPARDGGKPARPRRERAGAPARTPSRKRPVKPGRLRGG
jgi:ATP-dependent RNA helicase DeaD